MSPNNKVVALSFACVISIQNNSSPSSTCPTVTTPHHSSPTLSPSLLLLLPHPLYTPTLFINPIYTLHKQPTSSTGNTQHQQHLLHTSTTSSLASTTSSSSSFSSQPFMPCCLCPSPFQLKQVAVAWGYYCHAAIISLTDWVPVSASSSTGHVWYSAIKAAKRLSARIARSKQRVRMGDWNYDPWPEERARDCKAVIGERVGL